MGLLDFLKPKREQARYSGGDGASVETAIAVHARSSLTGVPAEYEYVMRRHGEQGVDWTLRSQALMERDGRTYDVLSIELRGGEPRWYYFDITDFFGKF